MEFSSATCSNCKKRFGWKGEKPPCPWCKHKEPISEETKKLEEKLEKEMLDDN
jgi:hypothetical protein